MLKSFITKKHKVNNFRFCAENNLKLMNIIIHVKTLRSMFSDDIENDDIKIKRIEHIFKTIFRTYDKGVFI